MCPLFGGKVNYLIGAPFAWTWPMVFTGAAYLYSGATGDVIYEIRGTQWDEHMGAELAGVGDVDHNGYDDFLMA